MSRIEAQYENGLLEPTTPLQLQPGERFELVVIRKPDSNRWDKKRLAAVADEDIELAEAGIDEWASALRAEDDG